MEDAAASSLAGSVDPGVWPTAAAATRVIGWLSLFLVILAFAFQGSRGLYEPDEGRYTNVALQMLDSGNWWIPHLHAEQPHLTKPPLTYWAVAASVKVFGHNEWAARLPNALAFVLTGLCVYAIAMMLGIRPAWLASAIWATLLGPFVSANVITTDTLLAFFETAAMAAFVRAQYGRDRWRVWLVLMWLAFGFAFLTKGPPALLPLLVVLIWTLWQKPRLAARQLFAPAGLALFAVVGLGWFVSVVIGQRELFQYFFKYEFIERIASDTHDRNASLSGIFKVYLPAMIGGALPWLLVPLTRRLRRPASGRSALDAPTRRLLWLWWLLPLAFFCAARSRMPLYVLPLFVPLALLLAHSAGPIWRQRSSWLLPLIGGWALTLLILKAAAAHYPTERDARVLAREASQAMAMMRRPADEIVFILGKPHYGLRFYSHLPVERIGLAQNQKVVDALFTLESLCDEIRMNENSLWLVTPEQTADFMRQARRCGSTATALNRKVGAWNAFEVDRPGVDRPGQAIAHNAAVSSVTLTGQ